MNGEITMGGRDVILVVDDQPAVLAITATMLRRSGYEVMEASGGQEALRTLESRLDVTVLLTDCDMPLVSGSELARVVLQRWPHIKIVAMSGQPRSDEMPDEAAFLAKPFPTSALVALMKAARISPVDAAAAYPGPLPPSATSLVQKRHVS
jgi:CheY-like chemotaxis protein